MEVFEENDPQEVKISKNTCLEGTSLAQTASFEPSCVRIGCVVWAVDLRKKKKIHAYIHYITASAAAQAVVRTVFDLKANHQILTLSTSKTP